MAVWLCASPAAWRGEGGWVGERQEGTLERNTGGGVGGNEGRGGGHMVLGMAEPRKKKGVFVRVLE